MKGFFRISAAVPELQIGNPEWNTQEILRLYRMAEAKRAAVFAVPELSLTGYTCGDVFEQELLLDSAMLSLTNLAKQTHSTILICGIPCKIGHSLFNSAAILQNGKIKGLAVKEFLPNSGVFYEKRRFLPAHQLSRRTINCMGEEIPIGGDLVFDINQSFCFGVEICEDLWAVQPPSSDMALAGAELLVNLSASNAIAGKAQYREKLVCCTSSKLSAVYLYTGAGIGESTSDLVFDGEAICSINGKVVTRTKRFQKESQIIFSDFKPDYLRHLRRNNTSFRSSTPSKPIRRVSLDKVEEIYLLEYYDIRKRPFIPAEEIARNNFFNEILEILSTGLARRMEYTHSKTMIIGVSGGIDSALALLICSRCADRMKISRQSIVGVTMPGLGTNMGSKKSALSLMDALGITKKTIVINQEVSVHLDSLGHGGNQDTTLENAQARERMKILMDLANSLHGIVIGTGDLSELALGWCTYNGDQMAMYNVNSSLPKTLVKHIVEYMANNADDKLQKILFEIIRQPFSPELIPNAVPTEQQIGSYELHDFFLWYFLNYGETPGEILNLAEYAFSDQFTKEECKNTMKIFLNRFFTQQFKRNPMPDGPQAIGISLSPRGEWRMPADMNPTLWLSEIE